MIPGVHGFAKINGDPQIPNSCNFQIEWAGRIIQFDGRSQEFPGCSLFRNSFDDQNQTPVGEGREAARLRLAQVS